MVTRIKIYQTIDEARKAKRRDRIDELGFKPLHTDFIRDGKVQITWTNDQDPVRPKTNMTRNSYIDTLAERDHVNIT